MLHYSGLYWTNDVLSGGRFTVQTSLRLLHLQRSIQLCVCVCVCVLSQINWQVQTGIEPNWELCGLRSSQSLVGLLTFHNCCSALNFIPTVTDYYNFLVLLCNQFLVGLLTFHNCCSALNFIPTVTDYYNFLVLLCNQLRQSHVIRRPNQYRTELHTGHRRVTVLSRTCR